MGHSNDDIERLLAEAEGASGGRGAAKPTGASKPASPPGRLETSVRVSATWGASAAALVFLVFLVVPFLGPISGAAGAFVATFFILLGQHLSDRRNQ
jgi:hypothetical protein